MDSLCRVSEACTSKAKISEAPQGRNELTLGFLARFLCLRELCSLTVADVWTTRYADWSLWTWEKHLFCRHSRGSDTLSNHEPGIIHGIAVEVAAVTILSLLSGHGDFCVDVVTFGRSSPAINLNRNSSWQSQMNNVQRHARPAFLHGSAVTVVDSLNQRVLKLGPQRWQNGLSIPGCRSCPNNELVVLKEWTAHCDLLHDSKTVRGMRRS